tara:strand:- start:7236 stop:8021 length:786 start_codon:yes stop_codon:yes gene_type:complete
MKRILRAYPYILVVALLSAMAVVDAQKLTGDHSKRTSFRDVWHVYAFDDDVDAAFEVIADDNSFTPTSLSTADLVEVLWGGSGPTARAFIEGIKPDSTRVVYPLRTNGTAVKTTSDSLMFFERAWLDSSNSNTDVLTIRDKSGSAAITTLIAGQHHSYIAHRFSPKKEANYITNWSVQVPTNTGAVETELRIYDDWADAFDIGDDYTVVDAVLMPAGPALPYQQVFDPPILIPQYGVALIVGKGENANCDAKVKMSGYVTR